MNILEKAPTIPDSAAATFGGTVSGFLIGISLEDVQILAGLAVAALTAVVLIQRIIINRRTLKAQKAGAAPSGNSE